jgi:phenylacetic acid degradation protein
MAKVYAIEGVVPVIHESAFVHPDAVVIGDVIVGPRCYVGPGASLRGDMGRLILGEGTNVQDNCVLHCFPGETTVIEADGHIGHGAVLHGCTVKRNALVGMNAVVMDGAVIGEESIVAAMSFIKAGLKVPPRSLIAGIPGKIIRSITDEEIAWKGEGTQEYQELTRRCRASLVETTPLATIDPGRPHLKTGAAKPLHSTKNT